MATTEHKPVSQHWTPRTPVAFKQPVIWKETLISSQRYSGSHLTKRSKFHKRKVSRWPFLGKFGQKIGKETLAFIAGGMVFQSGGQPKKKEALCKGKLPHYVEEKTYVGWCLVDSLEDTVEMNIHGWWGGCFRGAALACVLLYGWWVSYGKESLLLGTFTNLCPFLIIGTCPRKGDC